MSVSPSGAARIPEHEYPEWYGAVMISGASLSISGTQWALAFGPVWETCGQKPSFEIDQQQWPEYADIRKLLDRTDPKLLNVAYRQYGDPAQGNQEVAEVKVSPKAQSDLNQWKKAKEEEKTPARRRQITIDGKRVDLRSERAHMVLSPPIGNLIQIVPVWIEDLLAEGDPRVRRAIRMNLERLLAYRGHELPGELKQQILDTLSRKEQSRSSGQCASSPIGGVESERVFPLH